MKKITLSVSGMACGGCEKRVENALSEFDGIKKVKADHKSGKVDLSFADTVDIEAVKAQIDRLGFTVTGEKQ